MNLQRAVQLSVDIALHMLSELSGTLPDTMGETFIALREHGAISERTELKLKRKLRVIVLGGEEFERAKGTFLQRTHWKVV